MPSEFNGIQKKRDRHRFKAWGSSWWGRGFRASGSWASLKKSTALFLAGEGVLLPALENL